MLDFFHVIFEEIYLKILQAPYGSESENNDT